jgi:hypothetical protein
MRIFVLAIALAFIAMLGALTILDFTRNGLTPLGVVSVLVLLLFSIGIIGALKEPPRR